MPAAGQVFLNCVLVVPIIFHGGKDVKRYSYHLTAKKAWLFGVLGAFAVFVFEYFSRSGLYFGLAMVGVVAVVFIYMTPRLMRTSLEVMDEGIRYNGPGKEITVPWGRIRKLEEDQYGAKVVADEGSFRIYKAISEADVPLAPATKLVDWKAPVGYQNLLDEIKGRAPQAEVSQSRSKHSVVSLVLVASLALLYVLIKLFLLKK